MKKILLTVLLVIMSQFGGKNAVACKGCCPLIQDYMEGVYADQMRSYDNAAKSSLNSRADNFADYGKNVVAAEKEIQAALKSYEAVATSAAVLLKQHATAMEVQKNIDTYGPSSQSSFACPSEIPVEIARGGAHRRVYDDKIYQNMLDRNTAYDSSVKRTEYLKSEWTDSNADKVIKGDNIFPTNRTLSSDALKAGGILANLITNPSPSPKISDRALNTPAGEEYETLRLSKDTRLAPAQKALATILADNAPAYDAQQWAENLYQASGRTGTPVELEDGKLSANAVLNARVDARYANPKWLTDLHSKTDSGLIRELLVMKSINLEMLRRRLKAAQMARTVLGTQVAIQLDLNRDKPIHKARKMAVINRD